MIHLVDYNNVSNTHKVTCMCRTECMAYANSLLDRGMFHSKSCVRWKVLWQASVIIFTKWLSEFNTEVRIESYSAIWYHIHCTLHAHTCMYVCNYSTWYYTCILTLMHKHMYVCTHFTTRSTNKYPHANTTAVLYYQLVHGPCTNRYSTELLYLES